MCVVVCVCVSVSVSVSVPVPVPVPVSVSARARVGRYDEYQSEEMKALGMEYVDRETLFRLSDVVSLHIPLLPSTHHIIDRCAATAPPTHSPAHPPCSKRARRQPPTHPPTLF